jgi:hypothetical protein
MLTASAVSAGVWSCLPTDDGRARTNNNDVCIAAKNTFDIHTGTQDAGDDIKLQPQSECRWRHSGGGNAAYYGATATNEVKVYDDCRNRSLRVAGSNLPTP